MGQRQTFDLRTSIGRGVVWQEFVTMLITWPEPTLTIRAVWLILRMKIVWLPRLFGYVIKDTFKPHI